VLLSASFYPIFVVVGSLNNYEYFIRNVLKSVGCGGVQRLNELAMASEG